MAFIGSNPPSPHVTIELKKRKKKKKLQCEQSIIPLKSHNRERKGSPNIALISRKKIVQTFYLKNN